MADGSASALPYHEPPVTTILILSSYLLLSNVVNYALDKIIYCGLVGQVLMGVAWGTPGAKWIDPAVQESIVQLGYLGLIVLVYEGGLSTSFQSLKDNLLLSTSVAATGIFLPIGLSFTLTSLASATPLQSFVAGAALCSTSLGTTFTLLATTGLSSTRLGTVLTTAAMMDDVVGLVLVRVIPNVSEAGELDPVVIVRPIAVSIGLVLFLIVACRFIVAPVGGALRTISYEPVRYLLRLEHSAFVVHSLMIFGFVAGAQLAGTSGLFAAYTAGACVSWWDGLSESQMPKELENRSTETKCEAPLEEVGTISDKADVDAITPVASSLKTAIDTKQRDSSNLAAPTPPSPTQPSTTGSAVYARYYHSPVHAILLPFFFSSIGFAIPITRLFTGPVLWRGLVYALLMALAKLATGLWLVRLPSTSPSPLGRFLTRLPKPQLLQFAWDKLHTWRKGGNAVAAAATPPRSPPSAISHAKAQQPLTEAQQAPGPTLLKATGSAQRPRNPLSLYPATLLGAAMVARGEIGFLITSVAEGNGMFAATGGVGGEDSSELYLVVVWAVVLCTIGGPLAVGALMRRIRKLEGGKKEGTRTGVGGDEGRGPLGVFGITVMAEPGRTS